MATVLAKTYVIPVIKSVRSTCVGMQYTLETPEYIDVVTVKDASITCTCGESRCSHIHMVNIRRAQDAEKAAARAAYEALFDLSYGD